MTDQDRAIWQCRQDCQQIASKNRAARPAPLAIIARRLWFALSIVGRYDPAGVSRIGPRTAYEIATIIIHEED